MNAMEPENLPRLCHPKDLVIIHVILVPRSRSCRDHGTKQPQQPPLMLSDPHRQLVELVVVSAWQVRCGGSERSSYLAKSTQVAGTQS